ncbi:MAG: T9SS type A sorting domain-containing protein [Candidatus Eisenbacteria bacterium]
MSDRNRPSRHWFAAGVLAVALVLARTAQADVTIAITPGTATVQPDGVFEVVLAVSSAGSAFNGFSVVLAYDPARLTLQPATPLSLQEGCLMNGSCSAACGSTLHDFQAHGDSIVVNDYLFCNQVALAGPGQLYKLRFKASTTPGATSITVRRATFYNAGVLVGPVHASDATVNIPASLAVGDGPAITHRLRVEPNPARGHLQLVLGGAGSGPVRADILDLQGRLVRSFGTVDAGARMRLDWDGTDAAGQRAPGGIYLARIERNGRSETSRFILLR